MDFIGPILEVLEFTGPSICKYLKYHRKLKDFVSNFQRLQKDLKDQQDEVESRLLAELHFGKRKNPQVTRWLEDVVEITKDAQRVEDKVRRGKYFSRACLGKLVKEKTQEMKLLCDKGNSLQIVVLDDPSSSIVPLATSELVGEEYVKEKIWSYLEGDQVNKIGVCGMGGIGKTTIMKHIHNELLKKDKFRGLFRRIVWVTVSLEFDIGKLQEDIASGLNEKLVDNNITRRAAKLLAILEKQEPFVLILDDVWTRFSLEEVGVPEPTAINGCKLVLTTRSKEVARTMGCVIIDVKPLKSDEALKLFLDKVGNDILLSPTLGSTLTMIVDECAGLPLAIVTVAGSMKGISDPRLWKNALNELIEHKRTVAGTEADKFGILKFSYDHLKDEKIQHCFLYCALYPEDHKIPKDEIIEYWIEEGLIEEMQTRQAMKYKGHDILKKLEDNCLLEFTEDEFEGECVRVHDLLRDMALQITRKSPRFLVKAGRELPEEHEWKEDLLKVSLMYNYIEEIPLSLPSPNCPMLTTLLLSVNNLSTIPESFFDHMLGLKILDLSYNDELHSLPNSISKLVNLTTLLLKACEQLRKIPSLSNLGALKKLDLSGTTIEELPHGIELLTNLKYLDLSELVISEVLPKIPDGILPNLSKLQTLGVDYRIPWKMESGKLSKLENFTGRFLTNDMGIFFKSRRDCLSWYNIFVGRQILSSDGEDSMPIGMKFIQFFDAQIFGEPNLLPSDVQKLGIKECNDVRSLNDISGFQDATNLLQCKISGCEGMKCVLSSWLNPLPSLNFLEIHNMKILNTLFEVKVVAKSAPPPTIFSSLKTIKILFCPKIKKLFSPRLLLGSLQNLEEIKVEYCGELEEIIASEEEEESGRVSKLTLPKLKRLKLEQLPKLRCICSSSAVLVCDSIEEVAIRYCSDLKRVFGSWFNPLQTLERLNLQELESLKSVFDEEAPVLLSPAPATTFSPLVSITIAKCHQLKKLFSPRSLLSCLQNLEAIDIRDCAQMKEIVASEEEESGRVSKLTLPKLKTLGLLWLPTLRCICSSSAVLVCDSIKEVTIMYCSDLKHVFGSWFYPPQTLERLNLQELESLKSVFDEEALAFITIATCHQLKKLFSPRSRLSCLQNLETIDIMDCAQMEEIISLGSQEEEKALQLSLPKLRILKLKDLPALKSICSNISVLRCDSLMYLLIIRCTELKRIPLYLPQLDNGQSLPPPSLKGINVFPKEWWKSLEWDHPKQRDALLPFCEFLAEEPWWARPPWQHLGPLRQNESPTS
ncbi:hypothetical protein SLEP1_g10843 [Rubroshorea leprosula]|uniref:AAA+ ATPase domain-containing protein n=1 Tax=Rubroshorea leprosula TaxID=152421 RepID=A0AAV5IF77_9ROSI|nr:hypothetical protein SLEP1_g10843 [Rubroshorea leprosula]